jgi:serine/threonine protein kinase
MTQPPNPSKGVPSPDDTRTPSDRHDTLLLSDVPDASSLIAEMSASPSSAAQPGFTDLAPLAQRYDILAEAGHGSMGNVYKARDRETGEIVALKLLKREIASDQAMMERFKNELLFARKITHKNVCRVHEFNRIGGIAYTSMEFVEGESLRSVLNRFGGLPLRKAIDIVLQICSGLEEAHAQGIVHRDLKPENVMIDGQGNVKIMDFGIARSMEAMTRLTGSMVGTPAYMAPEQVAGKSVDYRTDIYALGLILYEVFTGKAAFQADNAVAVALKQMRESPIPPHEIEPTIPVSIERVILKCLEKEPPKRFQSVAELQHVLRAPVGPTMPAFASDPPSQSSQPTVPSRPALSYGSTGAAPPKRRRVSPVLWVLLGASLVFAAVSEWPRVQQRIAQVSKNLAAPAPPPAPKPPDFALETSAESSAAQTESLQSDTAQLAEQPEAAQPDAAQSSLAQPSATQPDLAQPAAAKPATAKLAAAAPPTVKHASPHPGTQAMSQRRRAASGVTAQDIQERTDRYGEDEPVAMPPVNDHTPSYLWVGRFGQEDRAQNTARKIENLGLPVAVIPRHSARGEFFVVLTGPFGPERVTSVMGWLQSQGFSGVRVVKNPLASLREGLGQDSGANR